MLRNLPLRDANSLSSDLRVEDANAAAAFAHFPSVEHSSEIVNKPGLKWGFSSSYFTL
jgi:hypothetical protein